MQTYNPNQSTSALTKKIAHLFVRLSNQYLNKKGVLHAYTPFLVQLWNQDGQTQAELCRKMGIDQPSAVRTLDRMERDQLIIRVQHKLDRRMVEIYLTPSAQLLKTEVTFCALRINETATKNLNENDKVALQQLLKTVSSNLEYALLNSNEVFSKE